MTDAQLRELSRRLRKGGIKYRAVHTKDGNEIDLLNINVSVSGVIPDIVRWLHGFGVGVIDWFER